MPYGSPYDEEARFFREFLKMGSPISPSNLRITKEEKILLCFFLRFSSFGDSILQRSREYYLKNRDKCREAKRRWYAEHREYALQYQRAYDQGVRIGTKGPAKRRK